MKIIREIYGLRGREGEVGIEVEMEGDGLIAKRTPFWSVTNDGSLRGRGLEFVLREPVTRERVAEAIDELEKLQVNGWDDSDRTGVHVHINCQTLTWLETLNFIVLYLAINEEVAKRGWLGAFRFRDWWA